MFHETQFREFQHNLFPARFPKGNNSPCFLAMAFHGKHLSFAEMRVIHTAPRDNGALALIVDHRTTAFLAGRRGQVLPVIMRGHLIVRRTSGEVGNHFRVGLKAPRVLPDRLSGFGAYHAAIDLVQKTAAYGRRRTAEAKAGPGIRKV